MKYRKKRFKMQFKMKLKMQSKMRPKALRKIQSCAGMTLVEVMVAFLVLMIGLAGLYTATTLSLKQVNSAVEIQHNVDAVVSLYEENKAKEVQDDTLEDITFSLQIDGETSSREVGAKWGTVKDPNSDYVMNYCMPTTTP